MRLPAPCPQATSRPPAPRPVPNEAQRLAMAQALERAAERERRIHAARANTQAVETDRQSGAAPAVAVEAVFLGSLPGFGGPWLTQYAHYLAERRGPVLILHVDDDSIDLELASAPAGGLDSLDDLAGMGVTESRGPALRLAGDDGSLQSPDSPFHGPHEADATRQEARSTTDQRRPAVVRTIDELVRRPAAPVRTILVHLLDPTRARTVEQARALQRWTIVCGAFDAAVVGAYRLLKQLLEARGRGGTDESGQPSARPRPAVGLMVMGSDESRSLATAKKLNTAAASYLAAPVELVGWRKQMTPVNVQMLGSFSSPAVNPGSAGSGDAQGEGAGRGSDGLWPAVVELLNQFPAPVGADSPASGRPHVRDHAGTATSPRDRAAAPALNESAARTARQAESSFAEREDYRRALGLDATEETEAAVHENSLHEEDALAAAPLDETLAAPFPHTRHVAASTARNARPAAMVDLDLSTFLHDRRGAKLGAMRLPARCPYDPHTQLALDPSGRLHLLRQCSGSPAPGGRRDDQALAAAQVRAALVDLIAVRGWVREHWELLQLSQRQCRFDSTAKPVLHLFTDQGRTAAQLATRLGGGVKLHLLQCAGDQSSTWIATELS